MKEYRLWAIVALCILAVAGCNGDDGPHKVYEPGVVVVDLRTEGQTLAQAQQDAMAIAQKRGVRARVVLEGAFAYVTGMPYGSEDLEVEAFRGAGFKASRSLLVPRAQEEPTPQVSPVWLPYVERNTQDWRDRQWGTKLLQTDAAWPTATGEGVTIAILDGGYAYCDDWRVLDQPEMTKGYDWWGDDDEPCSFGHGTHTASTALAPADFIGIDGVAPDATLMQLRVCGGMFCSTAMASLALEYAAHHGADIGSMSWGGPWPEAHLEYAVDCYSGRLPNCREYDLLLIAARGNYGSPHEFYPASFASVAAITAIDDMRLIPPWSSFGRDVELCAPGAVVFAAYGQDGPADYRYQSGTSMAAPHVAGVAALVMEAFPSWTSQEVLEQLRRSACDLGSEGWDRFYGHGYVDAWRALRWAPFPPCLERPIDWVRPTPVPEGG